MPINCLHTACFEITYHIVFLQSSLFQLIRLNHYDLILQFPTIFFESLNRKTRNSFQSIVENLMACTEHVSAHLRHKVKCLLSTGEKFCLFESDRTVAFDEMSPHKAFSL